MRQMSEGCASLSRAPLFNDNYIRGLCQLLQTGASFKVVPQHRSTSNHSAQCTCGSHSHSHSRKKKRMALKEEELLSAEHSNAMTPLTINVRSLEQEIECDQSKGRLPCVVMASSSDNLHKIAPSATDTDCGRTARAALSHCYWRWPPLCPRRRAS